MKNKKTQNMGAYFLSVPGLLVLLIILFMGAFFDAPLLCGFVLLFFLLCLLAYLWSKKVAAQLRVDVKAIRGDGFPDEEIIIELHLENQGFLATIWAEQYIPVGDTAVFEPKNCDYTRIKLLEPEWEGDAISQKFAWIGGRQHLKCQLILMAKKRSVTSIEHIFVQTGDGFGIGAVMGKNRPTTSCELYVYPRIYPVYTDKLQKGGSTLYAGKGSLYEDVTLLRNIRPYQPTDSAKYINWRMLAKQQQISVNLYENIRPQSVVFLLDLQSFSYEKQMPESEDNPLMHRVWEDDMELAISFVASAIMELTNEGCVCGLLIPGYEEMVPEVLYKENGSYYLEEYLRMLARISYRGGLTDWPDTELSRLSTGMGQLYIVSQVAADKRLSVYEFYEAATTIAVHPEKREGESLSRKVIPLTDLMDIRQMDKEQMKARLTGRRDFDAKQ